MRHAIITRETKETSVQVTLDIEGEGQPIIDSGLGFFDHMLDLFARHGHFDLKVRCKGDYDVDGHHSIEDVGIALGRAFDHALGDRRGIKRYGSLLLPMDEALVMLALDISGRPHLSYDVEFLTERAGEFEVQLAEEFFNGFARTLKATLHIKKIAGSNTHHILEALFKGFGLALGEAVAIDPKYKNVIPSSKGTLV
ncbi:imidazoleglycerol-phosphate dehydratase [Clostridia bacterium]|nr:imidazoleglycerol-phosphate dehydratase [Clostridia bacterium]